MKKIFKKINCILAIVFIPYFDEKNFLFEKIHCLIATGDRVDEEIFEVSFQDEESV